MIIPRYSLRWLLALLTVCGCLSLVLSYAFQGHAWAIGSILGLGSLIVVVALHAVAFSIAWLLTQFYYMAAGNSPSKSSGQSPFASGGSPLAPPQMGDPEPPAIMS
ncbi:MAG: hypothetical protein L0211_13280 [Planctomycetaceae bacterium]|nr:hypothetical protein [Planctomycetaceae bacterium]